MYQLLKRLDQEEEVEGEGERVVEAWRLYMAKIDNQLYFRQIAENTLKQLLREPTSVLDQNHQGQLAE